MSGVGGGSDGRHARLWRRRGRAGRPLTSRFPARDFTRFCDGFRNEARFYEPCGVAVDLEDSMLLNLLEEEQKLW